MQMPGGAHNNTFRSRMNTASRGSQQSAQMDDETRIYLIEDDPAIQHFVRQAL